ncbi:MAG: carbon monoxide dehydrogenase subunit G [Thermoproteota archaeon]|jgi:Uncharacterized conserved protein
MHYEGSLEVNRSIKEVYDFLINPKEISTIVPDLESLEVIDQNNFNMKAKVGVAFIKGTMSLKFQIIEKQEPRHAKIVGSGTGLQSSVNLNLSFDLQELSENSTLIKWSADVQLGGLIASVGSRLIDSTAKKYIEKLVEGIKGKLS